MEGSGRLAVAAIDPARMRVRLFGAALSLALFAVFVVVPPQAAYAASCDITVYTPWKSGDLAKGKVTGNCDSGASFSSSVSKLQEQSYFWLTRDETYLGSNIGFLVNLSYNCAGHGQDNWRDTGQAYASNPTNIYKIGAWTPITC
jgi:hypothetical protein